MNGSTVLVLVEWHKLEQDAATGMQLALAKLLLHPAPTCAVRLALKIYHNNEYRETRGTLSLRRNHYGSHFLPFLARRNHFGGGNFPH